MQVYQSQLVPVYSFNNATGGSRFQAPPLRQWRKQYQSLSSQRNASVGMPMDRPGSSIPSLAQCTTCQGAGTISVDITKNSPCTSCNPIINKTRGSNTSYTDTASYLQSRCSTYEQKISTTRKSSINYFTSEGLPIEPSTIGPGTQIRETVNCFPTNQTQPCNETIYKPNNVQYAQQGGVCSGSRIARLKYNTLNNNGAAFNSAAGAVNINSGRYQTEPSPSYYNKYKPQKIVDPRKTGAKTYCSTTTCVLE